MASIAITITSNEIGMVSTSFLIKEPNMERVLQALRHEYDLLVELSPEEKDKLSEKDILQLIKDKKLEGNQQVMEIFLQYIMHVLDEKVKGYEMMIEYNKLKDKYIPVNESK